MKEVCNMLGVLTVVADQCEFGPTSEGPEGQGPAQKATRFMTNSPMIGEELSLKCQGGHRHIELTGGCRTKRSEVYPDRLCRARLEGLVKQMSVNNRVG